MRVCCVHIEAEIFLSRHHRVGEISITINRKWRQVHCADRSPADSNGYQSLGRLQSIVELDSTCGQGCGGWLAGTGPGAGKHQAAPRGVAAPRHRAGHRHRGHRGQRLEVGDGVVEARVRVLAQTAVDVL